jgi:hypothetical protein
MKVSIFIAAVLVFGLQPLAAHAQGSLTPSGPPGATMLTLSQVEPRTPVDAVHTPGNSTTQFLITSPGSYYLTTNVVGTNSEQGIEISANNVTLDLNGFSVVGPANAYNGILISSGFSNSVVRNGIISGWNTFDAGIFSQANNVVFDNLTVSSTCHGIESFGIGGVVRNCSACNNYNYGIYIVGTNYWITGNNCVGNNTVNEPNGAAIYISSANSRIEGNYVSGSGPAGYGIFINNIAGNTNNVAIRNAVQGNSANDYFFNTSQIVGPLITNTVSGIITNSNPWANFAF